MKVLKRPMFRYGGGVKKQGIMHGMKGMQDGGPATMADATGYANGGMTMFPPMRGRVTRPGGYAGAIENFYKENILGPRFTDDNYKPKMNLQSGTGFDFMKPNVRTGEGYQNIMKKKLENENKQKLIDIGRTDIELDQIGSLTPIEEARAAKEKTEAAIARDTTNEPEKSIFSTEELQNPNLKKRVDQQFNTQKNNTLKKTDIFSPKETDEKRLKRIYEIMDVDGAKKDAAYNALIDLSQGQAIDTKDISGSINRAIGALSKRADKVTDLKDKGKAALASGTVQEMFRDKDSAQLKAARNYAELKNISVEKAYDALGLAKKGGLGAQYIEYAGRQGTGPASSEATLASYMSGQEGYKDNVKTKKELKKDISDGTYKDALDVIIKENITEDGLYKVGMSVIRIKDGKPSYEINRR
mgnify:CR=1 FL=1